MSDTQTGGTDGNQTTENKSIIYVWKLPVDKSFVLSINSILMASAALLSIIAFICVASGRSDDCDNAYSSSYNFFEFVSMSSFLTLVISWLFYVLTISKRMFMRSLPWIFIDLIYNVFYIVLYLIASIIVAAQSCGKDNNKAGSTFGFLAMICMIGTAVLQFLQLRRQKAETSTQPAEETSTEQRQEQY